MAEYGKYIDVIAEYADFCDQLLSEEQEKLSIMHSHDLQALEASVKRQETMLMKLQSFERQRVQKQKEAGLSELTMSQIIERLSGDEKERMQALFARLEAAAKEIKFHNGKSLEAAEDNLRLFAVEHNPAGKGYNQGGADSGSSRYEPPGGRNFQVKI